MQLGHLTIEFVDKLTMREYHTLNKLYSTFNNKEIDEFELGIELATALIATINGEKDKESIRELLRAMESIEDMTALNNTIAEKVNALQDNVKKKN